MARANKKKNDVGGKQPNMAAYTAQRAGKTILHLSQQLAVGEPAKRRTKSKVEFPVSLGKNAVQHIGIENYTMICYNNFPCNRPIE